MLEPLGQQAGSRVASTTVTFSGCLGSSFSTRAMTASYAAVSAAAAGQDASELMTMRAGDEAPANESCLHERTSEVADVR